FLPDRRGNGRASEGAGHHTDEAGTTLSDPPSGASGPSVYRVERAHRRREGPAHPVHAPRKQASSSETAPEGALLSDEGEAAVLEAFDRLGATVSAGSPKTLEDLAKEILRPMLK